MKRGPVYVIALRKALWVVSGAWCTGSAFIMAWGTFMAILEFFCVSGYWGPQPINNGYS